LGISVDSKYSLKAWADSLGGITYPLLSDFWPHGGVAQMFGVLRTDGKSERAIFIIDKNGLIRYVDVHDIDDQPDNEILFNELEKVEGKRSVIESKPEIQSQPYERPDVDVILYCTPWCPSCRRARAFFNERNIPFYEYDITKDRVAAQRVRGWARGYETTPTLDIKGTIMTEFNQARVAELLGINL
jgi:glutaredoxin